MYVCVCMISPFSRVPILCNTMDCSPPGSMGFSRQEYWSAFPCPSPGDLPDPGIEPQSLTSPALADRFFTTSATWEAPEWSILLGKIFSADEKNFFP